MVKAKISLYSLFFPMVFFILNGCGEAFRVNPNYDEFGFGGSNRPGNSFWTHDSDIHGEMDPDKRILFQYRSELEERENKTILLARKIKAFDFSLSKKSENEFAIKARITFNCNDLIDFEKSLTGSDLRGDSSLDIGVKNSYNLRVHCSLSNCSEIVAVIREVGLGSQATVLVGLMADKKKGQELFYSTRSVAYRPYFQSYHDYSYFVKTNQCTVEDKDSWVDKLIDGVIDDIKDKAKDEFLETIKDLF